MLFWLTPLLAFRPKNLREARQLLENSTDHGDKSCQECLADDDLYWCADDSTFITGSCSQSHNYNRYCSRSYSYLSSKSKYLVCPPKPSECGDQNIGISFDSHSYTVDLAQLPKDTVCTYKFTIDSSHLNSVQVSIDDADGASAHTFTRSFTEVLKFKQALAAGSHNYDLYNVRELLVLVYPQSEQGRIKFTVTGDKNYSHIVKIVLWITIPLGLCAYCFCCCFVIYKLDTNPYLNDYQAPNKSPKKGEKSKKNQVVDVRGFVEEGIAENRYESVQFNHIDRQTPYLIGVETSLDDLVSSVQHKFRNSNGEMNFEGGRAYPQPLPAMRASNRVARNLINRQNNYIIQL